MIFNVYSPFFKNMCLLYGKRHHRHVTNKNWKNLISKTFD